MAANNNVWEKLKGFAAQNVVYFSLLFYGAFIAFAWWALVPASAPVHNPTLFVVLAVAYIAFVIYTIVRTLRQRATKKAGVDANAAKAQPPTTSVLTIAFLSATAVAFLSLCRTASADDVIPDDVFIANECQLYAGTFAGAVHDHRSSEIIQAYAVAKHLCSDRLERHTITTDEWYDGVKEVRRTLLVFNLDPAARDTFIDSLDKEKKLDGKTLYALFLVPPAWLQDQSNVKSLHDTFLRFGKALGPDKISWWLARPGAPTEIDFTKNEFYCRRMQVNCAIGPFIIMTKARPDRVSVSPDDQYRVWLQQFDADTTNRLLAAVADNWPQGVVQYIDVTLAFQKQVTAGMKKIGAPTGITKFVSAKGDTFSIFAWGEKILPDPLPPLTQLP